MSTVWFLLFWWNPQFLNCETHTRTHTEMQFLPTTATAASHTHTHRHKIIQLRQWASHEMQAKKFSTKQTRKKNTNLTNTTIEHWKHLFFAQLHALALLFRFCSFLLFLIIIQLWYRKCCYFSSARTELRWIRIQYGMITIKSMWNKWSPFEWKKADFSRKTFVWNLRCKRTRAQARKRLLSPLPSFVVDVFTLNIFPSGYGSNWNEISTFFFIDTHSWVAANKNRISSQDTAMRMIWWE